MEGLKHKLENFTLSETYRKEILKSNTDKEYVPSEFIEIAKVALAGHFLVNDKISVHPTAIEFYYHEESNDGIKDPIVYHRNSKKGSKSIFNFGILHNHVSGIDITFEHGDSPERAIRASMLIREFEIDGKNENRSTMLYEALYQQSSIFEGISAKWIDGKTEVEVESGYRKNVAQYDENGKKITKEDQPNAFLTENKKYVQDLRKWQFKKRK